MRPGWPVAGRADELAMIMSALRRGVGCVVTGEPGVGRTIVIGELKRLLDATSA